MPTSLLHPDSLVQTLDSVNEMIFSGERLPKPQARGLVAWMIGRMGSPGRMVRGSYRGMPAPTESDFKNGGKVFTGEGVTSRAGLACKFGFEAMRAILVLADDRPRRDMVQKNCDWVHDAQKLYARIGRPIGMYCCASCSDAMWRLAAAGGIHKSESLLGPGLRTLSARRDGKGKWSGWPFYYTLLALSEADMSAARKELQYAASTCERLLKRSSGDKYALRRRTLLERVLTQV